MAESKTSNLDVISLLGNTILSTGRLFRELTREDYCVADFNKTIQLIWKRAGVFVETKERRTAEKLYPKYITTTWNEGHPTLFYKIYPGLDSEKIIHSLDLIADYFKAEILFKECKSNPTAHFSLTILSGELLPYIEYSNEETKIKDDGLWIPLGWSRRELEQIDLSDDSSFHLLIGGASGAGKSTLARFFLVMLHLKYTRDDVRLWLCDFKSGVDIALLGDNPRLVDRKISRARDLEPLVDDLTIEIERRYELFKENKCGASIKTYNAKMAQLNKPKMPHIIVFVDEYLKLESKDFDKVRGKMTEATGEARGAGVHFIVSCFRPTFNLIDGTMKNNFPTVVAFKCNSVSAQVLLGKEEAKAAKTIDKDIKGRALFSYSDQVLIQIPLIKDSVCEEIMSQYQKTIDITTIETLPTVIPPHTNTN